MAAVERKFVRYSLPPLTPPFYNSHALWPEAGRSIRAINTGTQKVTPHNRPNLVYKGYGQSKSAPAATFAHSELQDEADRNVAARAEGRKHTSANNDDEADDNLPSLEELCRMDIT